MANLLRTAISVTRWSQTELRAYNIVIRWQDAATFFGVKSLPKPAVAGELLKHVAAEDMAYDENCRLLRYMDMAMDPASGGGESAVDDFAARLLMLLGYLQRPWVVCRRKSVLLTICGKERRAKLDVCIMDPSQDNVLLLIQRGKQHKKPNGLGSRLIAGAIAAFQTNNYRQTHVYNQDPIVHKVMPGITLQGTSPIFYKIPVTTQLAQSVALGVYPAAPTVVHAHLPALARPTHRLREGMKPLDNRATILACYEAFKRFVN